MNFGREAKKSHLTSALYYRDSSSHLDDTQGDDKSGLKVRRQLSSRSHEIDMLGRLHTDIMHQERYMINGVDVKIRLIPSKEYLSSDGPRCCCRVQNCHHSCLFVCSQGEAQPSSSAGSRKALERGTTKRVVQRTFAIPTGNLGTVQDNLFLTQTPTKLVIGLVSSEAFQRTLQQKSLQLSDFSLVLSKPVSGWKADPRQSADS